MSIFDAFWFWTIRAQGGQHIDIAEGSGSGTDWGGLVGALGAVVGLVVLIAIVFFVVRFLKSTSSNNRSAPVQSISKGDQRKIQNEMAEGNFERAGDLLARSEQWAEAAEAYAQGGIALKAAKAFHQSGNLAQAIHFYKEAGDVGQAARIYAKQGKHMAAAAEYFQAGEFTLSAEQYAAAEDLKRAAEMYGEGKSYLMAGKYFERAEEPLAAAESYAEHFEDALSRASGDLSLLDEDRRVGRRAGEIFKEHGILDKASAVFQKAGFFEDAASCLRTTGELTKAADLLMKAEQPLEAARMLEEAGEDKKAAYMRAEAALADGDVVKAADLYKAAGEVARAIELYENAEAWGPAAELYERRGQNEEALEYFKRADKPAHAARCAEMLEKFGEATNLYRDAGDVDGEIRCLRAQGDYFRAGRLQFEHRRYSEALDLLGKIDSRDPIYTRSLELQGDVLAAQGRWEKAYSRYRAAMGNHEIQAATLPLAYKMGRALEEETDRTGALEYYNAILSIDRNFEDVGLRVKSLLGRGRRSTLPGAGGSGIFSSPDGADGMQRYEIVDEVARGGMGIVYRARDTVLGRIVAYKILGENLRDNETAVKYFLREARAAAALSHPNIVTIYDAGEQDGEYYMAMEFVEGTTLKELIKRKGALPEDQVRYILIHCCRALQYAHSKGIIHRDIKSGNVMITRDKALKIMDFGLAKFMREYQKDHTQQVGTPFYMSPEQIIGTNIDFRSDLYSLGCTIFECATGTVPFFKGDLSYHHVHTDPPSPRSINPGLSRELEKVILNLLEKDPDDRLQSAKEILQVIVSMQKA